MTVQSKSVMSETETTRRYTRHILILAKFTLNVCGGDGKRHDGLIVLTLGGRYP
jgi:hypothetical protein